MRYLEIIKWIGSLCTIGGAIATAFGQDPINVILFTAGALIWTYAATKMKEPSLIILNAVVLGIYVVGVILRICHFHGFFH